MKLQNDIMFIEEKKTPSAVEQIVKAIKNMIIENGLRAGDKIPNEFELSEKFGKSRGCVREAVKILESYGVLEVRRGDGTYVCGSASKGLFDAQFFRIIAMGTSLPELIQLRLILETGIICEAINSVTEQSLKNLCDAEKSLEELLHKDSHVEEIVAADMRFHVKLVEMTGNEVLKNVYINMLDIFMPFIRYSHMQQRIVSDFSVIKQHEIIICAIEERDYDLARYAVKNSLRDWEELNKEYLNMK